MSQPEDSGKVKPPQPALYSWSEVWTAAVTRPSVNTFVELLRDPAATPRRAVMWLYLTGCCFTFMLYYMLLSAPDQFFVLPPEITAADFSNAIVSTMLCGIPVLAALGLVGSLILTGAIHFIATRTDPAASKPGRFAALFYVLAAVTAPLTILSIVLSLISFASNSPLINTILPLVSLVLSVYQLVLMGLATQAVYNIGPRKAALAVGLTMLIPLVLLLLMTGY